MQFVDLYSSINNGIMPIYQIFGIDGFLRETAIELLKKGNLNEPDLNLTNFYGVDIEKEVNDFVSSVKSYPFLSEKRFIIVREFYPTAKELSSKKFSGIFDLPIESSVIIIVNDKKCEALFKNANVTSIDCERADDKFIIKWLRSEALKSGVIISTDSCNKLIEFSDGDMTKINGELLKLISFVGNNGQIDESVIDLVVSKDVDYEIYELTGYIADLKYDKALLTLKELINKNQDKQRLFISIYYHFRRLLHASISSASDYSLSEVLGVKEFAIKKARVQAKKFSPKRLKEICDKLSGFDSAFKRGDISVDSALWNAVFNAITI